MPLAHFKGEIKSQWSLIILSNDMPTANEEGLYLQSFFWIPPVLMLAFSHIHLPLSQFFWWPGQLFSD